MTVLIADDDRATRLILRRSLERWGFEVTEAADGTAAWESLQAHRPNFAILDWMMPGLDGVEVCRRLRSHTTGAYVYTLLLTAVERRSALIAGLDAGADDYLVKPVDAEELRARIRVGERVLEAFAQVKQLRGLLPICSYCKSIRTDADSWQQLERYVSDHSTAEFSHGICPTCLPKVMADFDDRRTS